MDGRDDAANSTRNQLVELARRTLTHTAAGTVPLATSVGRVPAEAYLDPERWALEMERVFRRCPLVVALSAQVADPGSYAALEVLDTPILVARDGDGALRAFLNVCSHRGAIVVAPGTGSARRFACPYHAWTYDPSGQLVGILDREDFGEVDPDALGLRPLSCEERAGLVFVGIDPDQALDLDTHLCGYDLPLGHLGLADGWYMGSQRIGGPNWKLAYDGYLDLYHLPILHRDTFGTDISNKAIYDAWGPHQRVSSPDRRLLALQDQPPEQWPDDVITAGVWTVFPHVSIAAFPLRLPDRPSGSRPVTVHMVSMLYPGSTQAESSTVQHFVVDTEPDEQITQAVAAQQAFLLHVVRDEDYATGLAIQRGLATGARTEVLFGRNEQGGQRFHGWLDALVELPEAGQTKARFEAATTEFQT